MKWLRHWAGLEKIGGVKQANTRSQVHRGRCCSLLCQRACLEKKIGCEARIHSEPSWWWWWQLCSLVRTKGWVLVAPRLRQWLTAFMFRLMMEKALGSWSCFEIVDDCSCVISS